MIKGNNPYTAKTKMFFFEGPLLIGHTVHIILTFE